MADESHLVLKSLALPVVRLTRELPLWGVRAARAVRAGQGPRAVFLPAYGRQGAALLRVYNMARALRARGWRVHVLGARLTLAQRRRALAGLAPDVVLMQGARHDLNRPALYPDQRIVFDMDDADFHLPHLAGPVHEAMGQVTAITAGSAYVADWCRQAGAGDAHVLWTGTPVSAPARPAHSRRPPVVAWAQSAPASYGREADQVLAVMTALTRRCPEVRLRLYDRMPGDDPGFMNRFKAAGITVEWRKNAQYRHYLASFDDVALGLSPICPENPFSRGKSFGKVLAYLDRQVPVIASDHADHAAFFTPATGVITNDLTAWIDAAAHLIRTPAARQSMAEAAFGQFSARLSTPSVAARLDSILRGVAFGAGIGVSDELRSRVVSQ